jgi:hypothetical protein
VRGYLKVSNIDHPEMSGRCQGQGNPSGPGAVTGDTASNSQSTKRDTTGMAPKSGSGTSTDGKDANGDQGRDTTPSTTYPQAKKMRNLGLSGHRLPGRSDDLGFSFGFIFLKLAALGALSAWKASAARRNSNIELTKEDRSRLRRCIFRISLDQEDRIVRICNYRSPRPFPIMELGLWQYSEENLVRPAERPLKKRGWQSTGISRSGDVPC